LGKLHDGEDVLLRLGIADDEVLQGLWGVGLLKIRDGAKSVDEFEGLRRQFLFLERLGGERRD